MWTNQKYATYFPALDPLSAGTIKLGFQEFQQWLALWRIVFLGFNAGAGMISSDPLWPRLG